MYSVASKKAAHKKWKCIFEELWSFSPDAFNETDEERKERVAMLEQDTESWFQYYFPKYTFAEPAQFHIDATQRIMDHPEWFEVRMWSRELAKSTRTMMETLYLCLTKKKKYVLLISNSLDNAIRLLDPYKDVLEGNLRIINDYGLQENPGNWTMSEFTTLQGVAFRALGAGQSPRGTRNDEARPDIILFDDLDTDEDCLNKEIISKKWRWVEEAAISTRSISKATTIIFCGNRIAQDCCVVRAMKVADHVDEINIRDKHGNSVWKEKNSEAHIDRVLKQKSYAAAQKEYFNNPLSEGAVFKQMNYKPARRIEDYKFLVCYTDPSYKDTNDYKATVLVGSIEDEYHVIKCFLQQTITANMIEWHYSIMDMVGNRGNCSYYMEATFMQDVLVKELYETSRKRGRMIPIKPDMRKKREKYTRIECMLEPLNRNGCLYLNETERNDPGMNKLAEQFATFSPGGRAHDDGPDAVEGAIWILAEKMKQSGMADIHCFGRAVNAKSY